MSILACGPFVGDIEFELLNFRPYVKWLSEVIDYEDIYVMSHSNRLFLYDWINPKNLFHIRDNLTRNEIHQKRAIHVSLSQPDFQEITKNFKTKISEIEQCTKKNIKHYNLSYVKSQFQVPIYDKIFEKLDGQIETEKKKIVFIPIKKISGRLAQIIYDFLSEHGNVTVVGDTKTHLMEQNVLLKKSDYFPNVYKYILEYINNASMVFCPISHWSVVTNLSNTPLFTWGKSPGQFKRDGIYNFDNRNCMSVLHEKTDNDKILLKMMEYFIKRRSKQWQI